MTAVAEEIGVIELTPSNLTPLNEDVPVVEEASVDDDDYFGGVHVGPVS